ncbi:MAG: hypothetical protein ACJ78W_05520 [Myxococcales bacterium]
MIVRKVHASKADVRAVVASGESRQEISRCHVLANVRDGSHATALTATRRGWRALSPDAATVRAWRSDRSLPRQARARSSAPRRGARRGRDGAQLGLGGPSIVVITGTEKRFRTTFTERD